MSLTPETLKDRFRREVDDIKGGSQGEDYLWSDDDVFGYMEVAQRMFVRRTKILRKGSPAVSTDLLTELTFTALSATGYLPISSKIIRILNARMRTHANSDPLDIVPFEELNEGFFTRDYGSVFVGDWQSKIGQARILSTNISEGLVRLVPIPADDDVVELIVEHLPLNTVTCDLPQLEVTELEDQLTIMNHMKHLAFLKQDADTYDPELSSKFGRLFDNQADERRREIKRTRFRARATRYGGIPF
jgi:hypothetical protein